MRDGTCPKCGGTEVHAARRGLTEHLHPVWPHTPPDFRGAVSAHRTTGLWHYACLDCGFTEQYVHDGPTLEFIRQTWMKVTPPPPPSTP